MAKDILILMGSPRRNGNTDLLCGAFARGAEAAGHRVEKIDIAGMEIAGCRGCGGCRDSGVCVQADDMRTICARLLAADVVVLASPIYFYSWTSQMKAVLDRTCALLTTMPGKTFCLLAACALPDERCSRVLIDSFRAYLGCYREAMTDGGCLFAYGTGDPGDVQKTDALRKAYAMGKGI